MNVDRTDEASADAVQDRVTVWPGSPVPPYAGALARVDVGVTDGDAIDLYGYARPYEERPLPSEWFLRELFEVPLDRDGLVGLFTEFGPGCPYGDHCFDLFPEHEVKRTPWLLAAQARAVDEAGHPDLVVALEVFKTYVRMARALTEHWIAHLTDQRDSEILAAYVRNGFTEPRSVEDAWRRFEDHVNAALLPYQVHVVTGYGLGSKGRLAPCWYSEVVLQLANHIAEEAPVTRCANEKCGRWFHRQRGRSTTGRHRTSGVNYCSKSCAEAQRQRDRRKTKKDTRR